MKPVAEQNLYELLEVPFDASESVIVEAWYRAERLHGPGSAVTASDSGCEAALWCARLEEAIEILLDPAERGRYDARVLARASPDRLAVVPEAGRPLLPARSASVREGAAIVPFREEPSLVRELGDGRGSTESVETAEITGSAEVAELDGPDAYLELPGRVARAGEPAMRRSLEARCATAPPPLPRRALARAGGPLALAERPDELVAPPEEAAVLAEPPAARAELPEVEPEEIAPAPPPEGVAPLLLAIPLTAFGPRGGPAGEVASGEPAKVTPLFGDEALPADELAPADDLAPEVEAVEPPAAPPPRPVRLARRAPASARGGLSFPEGTVFTGEVIRLAREARGLTVGQMSERTKVMRHHLENLEADRFDRLPATVYLRGILVAVAKELRLDGQKVARSYLERLARPPPAAAKGG